MSTAKPLVSAIIVSRNAGEQLLQCLAAFYACTDVPAEAIVVDNASSDGSVDAVAESFPQARLIQRPKDTGFGRAGNSGLSLAEGRFILLLSPEVTVRQGCVGRLADFLLTRPDTGAVSPRLVNGEGAPEAAARRGFPTPSSRFYALAGLSALFPHSPRFSRHTMGHRRPAEPHEIDAGTAACLLVRRSAVDRVGFFDPDYRMYGEDLDLCFRLKMGGWKVFYLPDARAVRARVNTGKETLRARLWHYHCSMWTFHHKHYAADLPAFANGVVWADNWGRWAYRAARAELTADPSLTP